MVRNRNVRQSIWIGVAGIGAGMVGASMYGSYLAAEEPSHIAAAMQEATDIAEQLNAAGDSMPRERRQELRTRASEHLTSVWADLEHRGDLVDDFEAVQIAGQAVTLLGAIGCARVAIHKPQRSAPTSLPEDTYHNPIGW